MIPDREYVFASSYIKTNEGSGTPGERLSRIKEAADVMSLRNYISEAYHLNISSDGDKAGVYDKALDASVTTLKNALPDFTVLYPLLLKYDCTNIKTALKCKLKNLSYDGLMFDCGTIAKSKIIDAVESFDFSKIPGEMGRAAKNAFNEYKKSENVRMIDLILDRGCFADMKKYADDGMCKLICDIVTLRADGVNAICALRIARENLSPENAVSLFDKAFVPGGSISKNAFAAPDTGIRSPEDIAARLNKNSVSYTALKKALSKKDFDAAQKHIDEAVLSLCRKFKFKPFGPEVAVSYLILREAEITNCRIAEASFGATDRENLLKERLRVAYV